MRQAEVESTTCPEGVMQKPGAACLGAFHGCLVLHWVVKGGVGADKTEKVTLAVVMVPLGPERCSQSTMS